jgi:hypothetical protein
MVETPDIPQVSPTTLSSLSSLKRSLRMIQREVPALSLNLINMQFFLQV